MAAANNKTAQEIKAAFTPATRTGAYAVASGVTQAIGELVGISSGEVSY